MGRFILHFHAVFSFTMLALLFYLLLLLCLFLRYLQRAIRKQAQCETFALILKQLLSKRWTAYSPQAWQQRPMDTQFTLEQQHGQQQQQAQATHPPRVVEFGCGSGNLLLPLAFAMPECHFHGIDLKPEAVRYLTVSVV